jgi:hypothetical protein
VVAQRLVFWMVFTTNAMDEVTLYLADLIKENKLSYKEGENFVDFAYDLYLNDCNDEEIELQIKSEIKQLLKEKENAKLL